jgi:hypothetical protein
MTDMPSNVTLSTLYWQTTAHQVMAVPLDGTRNQHDNLIQMDESV